MAVLGDRMAFKMALAQSMLSCLARAEEAIRAAGGDRSKVSWLKKKSGRRSSEAAAPKARPGAKRKHGLIRLTRTKPNCQVCRDVARHAGVNYTCKPRSPRPLFSGWRRHLQGLR